MNNSLLTKSMLLDESTREVMPYSSLAIANINESYFLESLQFSLDITKDLRAAQSQIHIAMLESASPIVVNEAFNNFIDKVKEIIDKFIKFIGKVFAKFVTNLNSIVRSDEYLKKHKNDILKFDNTDKFEMDIYKYTYLNDENYPVVSALKTFENIIGIEVPDTDPDTTDTTAPVVKKINVYAAKFKSNTEDFANNFRALVVNKPGENSISTEDYSDELFKVFRNGENTKTKTDIDYGMVNDAYNRFAAYKSTTESISRLKKKMEDNYKAIKEQAKNITASFDLNNSLFEKIYDNGLSKEDYDANKTAIDGQTKVIVSAIVDQVTKMCTIHSQAFTAKLDAAKQSYIQDKAILYRALKKEQKVFKKEV